MTAAPSRRRIVDGGRVLLSVAPVASGSLPELLASPAGQVTGGSLPLGKCVAVAIPFDDHCCYAGHRTPPAGESEPRTARRSGRGCPSRERTAPPGAHGA
jgi:hypothetical protein